MIVLFLVSCSTHGSLLPVSTLSKVEHDRLTPTYDKIVHLSERLIS